MTKQPILLDSITDANEEHRGQIVVSGSHGGIYPAAVASAAGIRAVLFNDAGIGLDKAGVAGVLALAKAGMAAASIDCRSCLIGSAEDAFKRGVVTIVNPIAAQCGLKVGMPVDEAVRALENAPQPHGLLPEVEESRNELRLDENGLAILLVDSASLVIPKDENKVIITGSHGCLIGGNPTRALKAAARIAVFNDAGVLSDDITISRLPALDEREVAAVTVSHETARIGDAHSALETGVISKANERARNAGAKVGKSLKAWLTGL
ncbi:hypothetical protein [Sneathiella sp. HT1-7]|jgi:hypothetical protein|uniref:hypothetical protein n=1 Tax=Sneathiella sp. HT1-7 TaxID=2887192 RepID=UPI001D144A97|nr:hypothetical protein [Sneathiella sp. HT1-7]MCC3304263.1 hypothetical protein [Sneathiella sp. HT1-7]